jgi:glyoxylase I family protein
LWYNKTNDLARLGKPNFRAQKETIMKRLTKGVHHIAIKCNGVAHFEKTMHFYHTLLGMPIVRKWQTNEGLPCAMVDIGGSMMEIFSNAPDVLGQGTLRHLAFAVESVDECISVVREAGYQITMEPTDICIPSAVPYPARIAFCIGPVGEEIEFFQEK